MRKARTVAKAERTPQRQLKVYCTEVGFHDAYVAVPNMKAALQAWGARVDLFHQQAARIVTDPELTAEPLARPGEIVLKPRGSIERHLQAAGHATKADVECGPAPRRRNRPLPSRAKLQAARSASLAAERQFGEELAELEREAAALRERRAKAVAAQEKQMSRLKDRLDKAQADYDAALAEWQRIQAS